ncbi:MAG: hypothetical protein J6J42_00765 [Lachnospiraceae bacterium]|nr:hypothetical protein [Lachnospiraceae bacterium]
MEKEDNLKRENYETEVEKDANGYALLVITALATLFFCVELVTSGRMNFGLCALFYAGNGTISWVKYVKLHKKGTRSRAIGYTIFTVLLSAVHIYELIVG